MNHKRWNWLGCLLLAAAATMAAGQARAAKRASSTRPAPLEILKLIRGPGSAVVAELSNGLTVIVKPTQAAPVVTVRCYVQTGSMYEGPWLGAGISHLLEHLVAKGAVHETPGGGGATAKPSRETRSRVDEIGGQSNAYTSSTRTCYYISAASSKTMACVDLIADWMARPNITEEDFRREHGVVQRELEMGKEDPGDRMWEAHGRDFFGAHPAALPVIGYARPLRDLTYQDVLAYHKQAYVPQNMVFCVAGKVDAKAVLDRVRAAMAGFKKGRSPRHVLPPVGRISSTRRSVSGHKDLKDTMVRISFRTIPLVHEDLYALDVLSYILSTGESSRLFEKIQRQKKLVTSIHSSSWTPGWGAGMFTIGFRAEPDKAGAAEKAVLEELRNVVAHGVTADELTRAKRQKVADLVYSQQTAEDQASTLAEDFMATGDAWFSQRYTRRIQSVTAKQVQAMAKKYFDFDAMVVTSLVPADRMASSMPASGAAKALPARLATLPNGLRVVLCPRDSVGLVSMALVTRGGVLAETPGTNGLGSLMTALSTQGAGTRSARQIAEFFDAAGGSIAGQCGNNTFTWQATVLDDSVPEALAILADVVQRPKFEARELERLRPVQLSAIRRMDEQWSAELQKFWRANFFGTSGYGLLPTGSIEVVEKATAPQIAAYHARHVKAGQSVLAIYGKFDPAATEKKVRQLFAEMAPGKTDLKLPPARVVEPGGELHTLKTNKPVAAITVARPSLRSTNVTDRLPLTVLDTIISGYNLPSGWLHLELRGKQLVYVVHAYNWSGLAPGAFVTYAACQPDKAREVVDIILKNLRKAASYKPSAEEIRRAVNTILTAELLDSQSISDLAMSAALDELYGFGYDFRSRLESLYGKVTPEDVLRVARKYLGGDWVVMVTSPKPDVLDKDKAPADKKTSGEK